MISCAKLGMSFDGNPLFENVSLKFLPGDCYGVIGSNGAGKSTFLKILSGELESTDGNVIIDKGLRISVLSQDQFAFDDYSVFETVLMGHKRLHAIYAERIALYSKSELSDKEGERIAELEDAYDDVDGYIGEADAASVLDDLDISADLHEKKMSELEAGEKVRVLLAKAIFGNPDVLLMDEPTNQLDYNSVLWLEKFLFNFKNMVFVVSHDRHFLNKVCTHIADVDFGEIKLYPGNYDFWKEASELSMTQLQDKNKKNESRIKELESFVRRFSANASKSKQATSRKNLIEKLRPDDLPVSKRRSPYISFSSKTRSGTRVVIAKNISHSIEGVKVLDKLSFSIEKGEKVAILGQNTVAKTTLLAILAGEITPDEGSVSWGETIQHSYFPKDNNQYFSKNMPLTEWLGQYENTGDIEYLRGFLGRMLFSGDDAKKDVTVLSGGEKARAMFSRMMITGGNTLIFDEPTDHLDLEAISALNTALIEYKECLIFSSHDVEILNTVADRIIEVSPEGFVDRRSNFEDYVKFKEKR